MDHPNLARTDAVPAVHTSRFAKILRAALAFVFLALLAPVAAEFGVKLAEEQAVYAQPTDKVRAFAAMLTGIGSDPLYQLALVFAAGLIVGA